MKITFVNHSLEDYLMNPQIFFSVKLPLIVVFTWLFSLSCSNKESNDRAERIQKLEEENTRLKLEKENAELQQQLSEIEDKKLDPNQVRLVEEFKIETREKLKEAIRDMKKYSQEIRKQEENCNCRFDFESNTIIENDASGDKSPANKNGSISYIDAAALKVAKELIRDYQTKEYRAEWMRKHGFVESFNDYVKYPTDFSDIESYQ